MTDRSEDAASSAMRDTNNVAALIEEGELAMNRGDVDAAVSIARTACDIAPQNARAARALSGFLVVSGDRDGAIDQGERSVSLDPSNLEAFIHLGGLLASVGRYREAADYLSRWSELDGSGAIGHRILSTAYTCLGRTAEAVTAARHAVQRDPENAEYRINLASNLVARGRHGDAIAVLNEAEAKFPGDARIHRAASGIYDFLGGDKLHVALIEAERAVALDPNDEEAVRHLDNVRKRLGIVTSFGSIGTHLSRTARTERIRHPSTLFGKIGKRLSVIDALLRRDMQTKFVKSKLGYFWAVFEPISHLMTLGVLFAFFNESPPPVGDSLFLFYCTGLMPYLMFSHLSMEAMNTRAGAGSLLMLPGIRQTDIVAAKAVLNIVTETAVAIIVFAAFGAVGFDSWPHHILVIAGAIGLLWLFAIGLGLINFVLREFMHSWETWYGALVRLLYFASGIYYSPISMPEEAHRILIWNPVLQAVELFRSGFYRDYHPTWIHPAYLTIVMLVTLAAGLSLEQISRRRIERHR
ncbi:tetratricopeptide repeat protein [Acidiphilium sp. PA]|uniref:tetratricopeptide repeat protein n=1 Tax=Acidiphilium sp. PA TaxID=2871705 RepID=UPI0022435262|nr:tetratricopeptide repeat protein [Acidiphilium sp. PA]MCW8309405.1 tetratricopeptide repeat protein [Acidiphilium sp. PA]